MRVKLVSGLLGFILIFSGLVGLMADRTVLAAQEGSGGSFLLPPGQEQPEEKLELESQYTVLRDRSGAGFEFDVDLNYTAPEPKRFNLAVTAPPKWQARAMQSSGGKEIGDILLDPAKSYQNRIKVVLVPSAGEMPEPGDYVLTLEVASGSIKESIELTAAVTARYDFVMLSATGRLNTEADAGEDNSFSIRLVNAGSAAIENVTFASNKPDGWEIAFEPDKVESVDAGTIQDVNVIIKPARKTIAGDYMVTLRANSKEVSDTMDLRITVLTPSIWGWVGILIVLAVVAGLGVIFWRFGRR